MRKVRWGSILLGLMMLLTLLTVTAFAAETTVAATDNAAANGQALVDAVSRASEGDTIVVPAGTYEIEKPIVITESITIKGANAGLDARPGKAERTAETVLDGNKITDGWDSGCIFVIAADNVTIDGFTFDNANYAAVAIGSADNTKISEVQNAVIENNIFKSTARTCDQAITGEEQKYPYTVRNNYFLNIRANSKVLSAHGLIVDNQFDNCSASDALVKFNNENYGYDEDLTFSGNTVNGFSGAQVVLAQWLYNVVANDNAISNCDTTFVSATVSTGIQVNRNSFSDVDLAAKNLIDIDWFDFGTYQGFEIQNNNFGTGITRTTGKSIDVAESSGNNPIPDNNYDKVTVDASKNFWGENATAEEVAKMVNGSVSIDTYYTDEDMTQTETVGGIPVSTADELAAAIANAQPGDTIVFLNDIETTTDLEITKDVTIDGNGHKLTADNCVGFYIKDDLNKFTVRDLTLVGVLPEGATAGEGNTGSFMGIGNYNQTVNVDLLTLDNVTIEGFSYGLYIGNASKQGKTSVQADNLTIQNCYIKGAYFECLTDSTFTNCKFLNNGTDEAKVESNFQQWMCGVDVNLKYGDFNNIAFNNCVFTGNGDNDGMPCTLRRVAPAMIATAISRSCHPHRRHRQRLHFCRQQW